MVADSYSSMADSSRNYESDNDIYESAICGSFFLAGFINQSAVFMFFEWIRQFAKWIRTFFNAIRHINHESGTFFRKNSRLPLLDISKRIPKCLLSALFIYRHAVFMIFYWIRHVPIWIRHSPKWIRHKNWCFLPFLGEDSFTIVAYSFIHMADSFISWS